MNHFKKIITSVIGLLLSQTAISNAHYSSSFPSDYIALYTLATRNAYVDITPDKYRVIYSIEFEALSPVIIAQQNVMGLTPQGFANDNTKVKIIRYEYELIQPTPKPGEVVIQALQPKLMKSKVVYYSSISPGHFVFEDCIDLHTLVQLDFSIEQDPHNGHHKGYIFKLSAKKL